MSPNSDSSPNRASLPEPPAAQVRFLLRRSDNATREFRTEIESGSQEAAIGRSEFRPLMPRFSRTLRRCCLG